MMPDKIDSTIKFNNSDSCNNCCCFQWKRGNKSKDKVTDQSTKITDPPSLPIPKRIDRSITQMHLDMTKTEDVQFVQDYRVKE